MNKIHILFISSNPTDTARLGLKDEFLAIENEIRKSKYEEYFLLSQRWETRINELHELISRTKPDIIHFSGHGSDRNELIFQKPNGNSDPVSPDALTILFSAFKDSVQCVVLNACYSEKQAESISEAINFVIGASGAIGDSSAIEFSKAFYRAVGNRKSIRDAFKIAQNEIQLPATATNNKTKLYSRIDTDYSFVNRRIQANKLIKDIKTYAPAAAGGYLAARVWDKVKSVPKSTESGEAIGFDYDNVSQLKQVISESDLMEDVAEPIVGKILNWLDDAFDFLR